MMFQSLLEQFQALPSGTDSFKQLKNHCEQQIKTADLSLEQNGPISNLWFCQKLCTAV